MKCSLLVLLSSTPVPIISPSSTDPSSSSPSLLSIFDERYISTTTTYTRPLTQVVTTESQRSTITKQNQISMTIQVSTDTITSTNPPKTPHTPQSILSSLETRNLELHNTSKDKYIYPEHIQNYPEHNHIITNVSSPFSTTSSTILMPYSSSNIENIHILIIKCYNNPRLRFRESLSKLYTNNESGSGFYNYDLPPITPFLIHLAKLWGVDLLDLDNEIVTLDGEDPSNPPDEYPYYFIKAFQRPYPDHETHFYTFISPHLLHISNATYFHDNITHDIYALPITDVSFLTIPHNLSPLDHLPIQFQQYLHSPNTPIKDIIFSHH